MMRRTPRDEWIDAIEIITVEDQPPEEKQERDPSLALLEQWDSQLRQQQRQRQRQQQQRQAPVAAT